MTETVGLLIILGFGSLGVWLRMGGRRWVVSRMRRWRKARRFARSDRKLSLVAGDEV